MDNPWGNALFLLCVVRIERQERDNQMTTEVIQSFDSKFMLFHLEMTRADGTANCSGLGNLSEPTTEMIIHFRSVRTIYNPLPVCPEISICKDRVHSRHQVASDRCP
jgi:hypothetical protein